MILVSICRFMLTGSQLLRRSLPKPVKIETNDVLNEYVSSRLAGKWSLHQTQLSTVMADYTDTFHNHQRRHALLDVLTRTEYETYTHPRPN